MGTHPIFESDFDCLTEKMSLITDPWDDDDVQVEELDSRFKKIRTVQHRTHSAWNDTSAPNRPALAQVEIKPTVRIMRRDTNPENEQKKPDSPEIAKQTFAQKEQAYAEARKRILGITDEPVKQPIRNESSRGRPRGGNRGRNNRDNRNNREDNRDERNNRNHRNDRYDQNSDDPPKGFAPRGGGGSNRGRGRSNGYRGRGRGRQSHDRET